MNRKFQIFVLLTTILSPFGLKADSQMFDKATFKSMGVGCAITATVVSFLAMSLVKTNNSRNKKINGVVWGGAGCLLGSGGGYLYDYSGKRKLRAQEPLPPVPGEEAPRNLLHWKGIGNGKAN